MTRANRSLAAIEALLTTQRDALLAGDLDLLAQLPRKLEQAMTTLTQLQPSDEGLARVSALAERNARLIAAAQRGLARARDHHHSDAGTTLSTYDASGRQTAAAARGRLLSRG